jgi:hypothetical protein
MCGVSTVWYFYTGFYPSFCDIYSTSPIPYNCLVRALSSSRLPYDSEDVACAVFADSCAHVVLGYEVGIQHEGIFMCECGDGLTYFETADFSCIGFVFVEFMVCDHHLMSKQNKIMTLITGCMSGTELCPFLMLHNKVSHSICQCLDSRMFQYYL